MVDRLMAKKRKKRAKKRRAKGNPLSSHSLTPGDLRASIQRNIAQGLSRDEAYELIDQGLVKGGFLGEVEPYPPEALEDTRRRVREMVDEEFDQAANESSETRDWIIADSQVAPRRRGKPQDLSVESYMRAMAAIFHATRGEKGGRKRDAIMLWQRFRDSRVFHFEPEVYAALHHEADLWTTTQLAGLEWQMPGTRKSVPEEETDRLNRAVLEGSKKFAPYPDKFPFPSIFVGYGAGIALAPHQITMHAPAELQDRITEATVLGHLIADDGYCCSVAEGMARGDDGSLMSIVWFNTLRSSCGWVRSEYHLEPWILPPLVNIINDHRTFILETPMNVRLRGEFKRNRKGMGLRNNRRHTPPPYYTLRMKTKLIKERVRKGLAGLASPATYKTDCRAHERCRIARGPFPLNPERGAKFRKRGYKVFTTNLLDEDTLRRLHERGQPYKRADEWLAILTTWVDTHLTNNDPDLPYIPAVRVPSKTGKSRQPTRSWADDPGS